MGRRRLGCDAPLRQHGSGAPFPVVYNVADMFEGYRIVRELADSEDHIIPGHDPLVMVRYPPPSRELEGSVVRLDVAPRHTAK